MKKGSKFFHTITGKIYVDSKSRDLSDLPGKGKIPALSHPNPLKGRPSRNKGVYKPPIYELPNGIKVTHESKESGRYIYCYIEARPDLFPNSKISKQNKQRVQRSRIIMTSILNRPLATNEHVHHKNEDEKFNDHPDNLEILWCDEHNKHHKLGFKHTEETKKQISLSLNIGYQEGRYSRRSTKAIRDPKTGRFI